MRPEGRRRRILELLRQRERISVDELAWTLSTSQEAIRRDLTALAEQGLVSKFHGGVTLPPSGEHENASQTRMNEHVREKRVVACCVASLFGPGDSIFIDTSTTTLLFVRELACQSYLTVVTSSLLIADSAGASGNRAFTIGGGYHLKPEQSIGALATEQIVRFNAEYAVITVGALNGGGAIDFFIKETETARATIAQARQLTVIAGPSKLGWRVLFQVFPLSRINRPVVDRKLTGELWEALQQAWVEIHEAPLCTPQV